MNIFPIGAKTPNVLMSTFSQGIWKLKTPNTIYLTFDDGPTPVVTEFVLRELDKYHAKATFFCIGKNVKQHPEIFKELVKENHAIGNHTMNHLSGWRATAEAYKLEVENCENELNKLLPCSAKRLFRPPYGRITPSQIREVTKTHQLIFWDVLSYDFNQKVSGEEVSNVVLSNTEEGSIVVFHDSEKAFPRLKIALPKLLEHYSEKGFQFKTLDHALLT